MKKKNGEVYEPRWFIWAIVFIIVVGVSLSAYIMITAEKDTIEPVAPIIVPKK